jgi:hypothetical protein
LHFLSSVVFSLSSILHPTPYALRPTP